MTKILQSNKPKKAKRLNIFQLCSSFLFCCFFFHSIEALAHVYTHIYINIHMYVCVCMYKRLTVTNRKETSSDIVHVLQRKDIYIQLSMRSTSGT